MSLRAEHLLSARAEVPMKWNVADIHGGMDVFALDGKRLGCVTRVWVDVEIGPTPGRLGHLLAEGLLPVEDVSGVRDVSGGYFLVDGSGGEASGSSLYMPFEAVQILFPGQNVTMGWSAEECVARFRAPPSLVEALQT
jgi:hypothetical protein